MKKTLKTTSIGLLSIALLLAGCGGNNHPSSSKADPDYSQDIKFKENPGKSGLKYDTEYYDNNDFNDYATNGNSTIEGQWPAYGTGDPYIMRFNGMYYLYVSTTTNGGGTQKGVLGWKSKDLVNWKQCQGEGLPLGYVCSSTTPNTEGAYAPEVYYSNGLFYMYESRYTKAASGGEGHYVLASTSPEGPFVMITDNKLDSHIDASIVFDTNENSYFLTAATGYIRVNTMPDMSSIVYTDTHVANTAQMGGWTEGPRCIEYMGKYYLTYTGLHVGTPGYQVCYAVSDGWAENTAESFAGSFRTGAHEPFLVNCNPDNGFVGLGHSSSVLGPDLDSYYISYHCLNSRTGPIRHVNIDRILFSGDLMTTYHNRYDSVKATGPEFSTENANGLIVKDDMILSETSSGNVFSAEYNIANGGGSKLVFSYKDSSNYNYVKYDLSAKTINVYKVVGGSETLALSSNLQKEYNDSVTHTIRIASRDGKFDLHFDEISKINAADFTCEGGQIGYKLVNSNADVQYTCFSNVARGTSDRREVTQALGDTPATAYMLDNQISGVMSYSFTGNSGNQINNLEGEYKGTGKLLLENKYDFARYLVNFHDTSNYGMELVIEKKYCGSTICVSIDDGENQFIKIPEQNIEGNYIRLLVGNQYIEKGIHQVKIQAANGEFAFTSFAFSKRASSGYVFLNELSSERIRGMTFADDSQWDFQDGALHSNSGIRNFAKVDENNLVDFELSVDMMLAKSESIFTSIEEAGVIFHQRNYASYKAYLTDHTNISVWSDRFKHLQGYYISFTPNTVKLSRYNFGNTKSITLKEMPHVTKSGEFFNLHISVRANTFSFYQNNSLLFTYTDDLGFNSGSVGLYTTGGEVSYKNLKVLAIEQNV